MNYTVPNATGYNYYLQNLQNRWYGWVCRLWGINDETYNCFGKAERNKTQDGFIPEYYNSGDTAGLIASNARNTRGGIFFEDTLAAVSFFHLLEPIRHDMGMSVAKFRWMFFVDLAKIKPGGLNAMQMAGQRADEIVVNDVKNFMQGNGCQLRAHDAVKDIDKVLMLFTGTAKNDTLKQNMGTRMAFYVECELKYNPLLYTTNISVKMPRNYPISLTMFIVADPPRDASNPANLIAVGAGKFVWKYYAPGDTLTPMSPTGGNGYAAGLDYLGNSFLYNGSADDTPTYSKLTGSWDRSGSQGGFNIGDIASWTIIDYQKI